MSAFKTKLANFQDRFKNLLGAKAQGYDNLNTLEQPLVQDVHEQEEYERQHGVGASAGGAGFHPAPGAASTYYPPQPTGASGYPPAPSGAAGYPPPPGAGAGGVARVSQGPMPSQVDELQELSLLARDAAEILWEMVAMGESGATVRDMKDKAEQLQAQLRGLIGDYQGGDEAIFAKAFESFDMLSRCLEEQNAPAPSEPPAALLAATPPALAPPAAAAAPVAPAASRPDEAPLISFD